MPLVPFATQSKPGVMAQAQSGERLVNYFARATPGGVSPVALLCRGGLSEVASASGQVEAMVSMGGTLYAVIGGALYCLDGATLERLGDVATGPARIATNGTQIAVVAGNKYFLYDGLTVAEVATGAVILPTGVAYMDGYFVVSGRSAGRADALTVSGLFDGATFSNLDFAFAEKSPDPIVEIRRDHDRLWVFGSKSAQLFYNSGNVDFPISPVQGATIEHGCKPNSVVTADNAAIWVRPNGAVLRSGGDSPQIISTPEVQDQIGDVTHAYTFSERGHEFFAIRQEGQPTLVYDFSTGLWHERSSGVDYGAFVVTEAQEVDGVSYFGTTDGQIATASERTYQDFGAVMMAEATSMPVQQGAGRFFIARLHASFSGGLDGMDRTPRVALRVSRDGYTWSDARWRDLASLGGYGARTTWHGMGQFRRAQFRFRVTDPVSRDLLGVEYG